MFGPRPGPWSLAPGLSSEALHITRICSEIDNDNAIRLWRRTALELLLIFEWRKQFHQLGMALQHSNIKELQLPENKKQKKKKKDMQK